MAAYAFYSMTDGVKMKKITSLIAVLLIIACFLSGCAESVLQEQDSTTSSTQAAKDEAATSRGQLTVELNFTRGATIASSQYAVWVENDAGQLVKLSLIHI